MRHPGPDPDEDLLIRVGRGEPAAARALVASKLPRLLSLARRMLGDVGEAEDVAQEVFLRTWKQAPTWRTGEAKLDSWMHRVALNLCYDRLRRRREDPMADPPEQVDPAVSADRGLITRQTGDAVASAMATLPARQRAAIVLCYYQELSNIEAAALMEVSIEAMESLLARARRTLRVALSDVAVQD